MLDPILCSPAFWEGAGWTNCYSLGFHASSGRCQLSIPSIFNFHPSIFFGRCSGEGIKMPFAKLRKKNDILHISYNVSLIQLGFTPVTNDYSSLISNIIKDYQYSWLNHLSKTLMTYSEIWKKTFLQTKKGCTLHLATISFQVLC